MVAAGLLSDREVKGSIYGCNFLGGMIGWQDIGLKQVLSES